MGLTGYHNGEDDIITTDYTAQINWGDSPNWTGGDVASDPWQNAVNPMIVLGSHNYSKPGQYPIVVYITGPGGETIVRYTCDCSVSPMPTKDGKAAPPPIYTGNKKEGEVSFATASTGTLNTTVGVASLDKPVAVVAAEYNGVVDGNAADYPRLRQLGRRRPLVRRQRGSQAKRPGLPLTIGTSHTYKQKGKYDIVVYLTGPDGQTLSQILSSRLVSQ